MNVVVDSCHRTEPHAAHTWLRSHVHYESLCPGRFKESEYRRAYFAYTRDESHIIRGEN